MGTKFAGTFCNRIIIFEKVPFGLGYVSSVQIGWIWRSLPPYRSDLKKSSFCLLNVITTEWMYSDGDYRFKIKGQPILLRTVTYLHYVTYIMYIIGRQIYLLLIIIPGIFIIYWLWLWFLNNWTTSIWLCLRPLHKSDKRHLTIKLPNSISLVPWTKVHLPGNAGKMLQ